MRPLNRNEFATALKKGLGRAWWHVANYGLDDVADLVLEACLHNQQYDPLCESSRAPWLFEMFGKTPPYSRFRDEILGVLKTKADNWPDSQQLCGLAKEMAAHGDEAARQTLKNYAFDKASHSGEGDGLGSDEWIELTGVEGVVDLTRIYGQRLLVDPNDNPYRNYFGDDEIEPIYQAALFQAAQNDPAISAYWTYLEAVGTFTPRQPIDRKADAQERRQCIREEYPLDRILADAKNSIGKFPGHYMPFGRYATPEELETVYAALLSTPNDAARVRLLWVFRRAPLPKLDDIIFNWAVGDNEDLREAASVALAQTAGPRVRALARSKVTSGQLIDALELFLHSYQSEDATLIESALANLGSETDEEAHSLGLSLRNIAEEHSDLRLVASLQWAYENTPCTLCRHGIVKLLDQYQALDEDLLQECLHDAEEDTRALAQQRLEQQQS